MRLHERPRDLVGRQRRALRLAPAERGAVAARQRARVGLHHPHEVGGAATRDADSAVAVERGRLPQEGEAPALVHTDNYQTHDE